MIPTLAYRPFLEPLPMDPYWLWFALPLVLAVAVVYKTIKLPDLQALPLEALKLAGQVLLFMALGAAALSLLTWMF